MGHKAFLQIEELRTLITKAEGILNARPLTYMSDADCTTPLRPIDFLIPVSSNRADTEMAQFPPDSDPEDAEFVPKSERQTAVENWKKLSDALERFWVDWRERYLVSLRERKCNLLNERHYAPKIGEVVIIENEMLPRGAWSLGRIMALSDRAATVKTAGGSELRRALSQLYPLELENSKSDNLVCSVLGQMEVLVLDESDQEEGIVVTAGEPEEEPATRLLEFARKTESALNVENIDTGFHGRCREFDAWTPSTGEHSKCRPLKLLELAEMTALKGRRLPALPDYNIPTFYH